MATKKREARNSLKEEAGEARLLWGAKGQQGRGGQGQSSHQVSLGMLALPKLLL